MKCLDWFVREMEQSFLITVDPNQVSYETVELYQEEIDDVLFPPTILMTLPDPLLIEIVTYNDADNNEWLAGIVIEQETNEWLHSVISKNEKALSHHQYKQEGGYKLIKYHKVVLNGKTYYREFCESTGFYKGLVTEEILVQQLLDESTHSMIEIDEKEIQQALSYLHPFQKTLVETYINYLGTVIESFERTHDKTKEKLTT